MYTTVLRVVFSFLLVAGCTSAAKLPKYITPCKRNSADLNACVKKETINALPHILEGDRSLKLPNMKPFKLPEVSLKSGSNLKITLIDLNIFGLDNNEVKDASLDVKQQHFQLKILMHRLNLQSQYEIEGRILVLPISGKGPCNITFTEADFTFDVDYVLEPKNGKDYLKLKNPKLQYTTEREYFYFDNLFNGDQRLGEEMNRILDDNWQQVSKDFNAPVIKIFETIVTIVFGGFFDNLSYDVGLPSDQMNEVLNENWQTVDKDIAPLLEELVEAVIVTTLEGFIGQFPYDTLIPPE